MLCRTHRQASRHFACQGVITFWGSGCGTPAFIPIIRSGLFRKDAARWADREVHSHLQVHGEIATLRNDILHNDAPTLSRRFRDLDRYTRYEAAELRKNDKRFRWYDLLLRPWAAFLYRYVRLGGYHDGWRGLIYCAYYPIYVFLVRAKLWEIEELQRTGQL